MLVKTLKWPVISLLITGGLHFTMEAIWPDLKNTFIPPVLTPVLLAYGIWIGYKAVHYGGNYLNAIIAGAIAGLLPFALDTVGFGMVLGRGVQWGLLAGIFGFAMVFFGSLIGSGFALGQSESKM
ncbi:MAG TPA: hypothetical protein VHM28_07575 [Anaerolineales bacterium]|jgi:ABC-type Co2+ transport system permease subunit|nr:hypothetical protein [Anaerolineales bacterium]